MTTKDEALQMALEALTCIDERVTAELRRLHEVNQELLEALQEMHILYGCKYDKEMIRKDAIELDVIDKARAAITKATGGTT